MSPDKETENVSWLKGVGVWAVYSLVVIFLGYMNYIPAKINRWIINHNDPKLALILLSVGLSGIVIVLLKFGITLPFFKAWVDGVGDKVKPSVLKIPWAVALVITSLSWGGLFLTQNPCVEPTVAITVDYLGEKNILNSSNAIIVKANSSFSISAIASGDEDIKCQWESPNPMDLDISKDQECDTNIIVRKVNGTALLTLKASYPFCDQLKILPLYIQIEEE